MPPSIAAEGRVEVRGELVMLRSTFAAYNAAHPDKPLINPRGAAAGTIRAKDPAVVAERRLRFFAFDLDTDDGAQADVEDALRTLGFDAADMRHCEDAAAAQEAIAAIEAGRNDLDYDLDGAVLRLADRNAYAAAARDPTARAARWPTSSRPRRRRPSSPTSSGTSGRSARSRRPRCSSPSSSAAPP